MAISVRLIEHPTDSQIEEVVEFLIRAFNGDVSLDAMTGGNAALQAPLFRSMVRAGALEGSFYTVNDDGSNKTLSVGIWFGPGTKMFLSEAQRQQGWNSFFPALSPGAQSWWTDVFLLHHETGLNNLLGSKYLDGWFGNIIATDPNYQRKGYATALIKTIFKRAAEENKAVSLATQNAENCHWYQKLGFKLLGQIELPAETGAWPDFFLTWEPAQDRLNSISS